VTTPSVCAMSALAEPTLYARADALKLDAPISGLSTVPIIPLQPNAADDTAVGAAVGAENPNLSVLDPNPNPTPKARPAPKSPSPYESDDDEEYDDARSVDSSDEGSLVDFIVKEDGGEEAENEEPGSEDDDTLLSKEEEIKRDLDGIDRSNIVLGKRTRRATVRYEETVFGTQEYKKMMLCDVPDSEMHALEEEDSDDGYSQDEEDEEYDSEGEEEEEEDDA